VAKLGRDLSTIVMVDDNPLSYRGFEPNSVRVAGFWGLSEPEDEELMSTLFPTLWTIADHEDVRYHLSGLEQPQPEVDEEEAEAPSDGDDLLTRQRRHSRKASAKFLSHLKEAIVAENEEVSVSASVSEEEEESEDEEEDGDGMEQTPMVDSDVEDGDGDGDGDEDERGSVDSISSERVHAMERRATEIENENGDVNESALYVDSIVSKYASMPVSGDEALSNDSLESPIKPTTEKSEEVHTRQPSQISDSGIGSGGALIFDSYNDEVMLRDAYESPKSVIRLEKRPSVELDLEENNEAANDETEAGVEDRTGKDLARASEEEEEEEDGDVNVRGGDYVVSVSTTASSRQMDSALINGHNNNSNQGMHGKHRASIRYEDEYRIDGGELQFVATGTRPSRTPTPEPVTPRDSGCSCFGWFSNKKKKSVGLAQQELR